MLNTGVAAKSPEFCAPIAVIKVNVELIMLVV